MSRRRSLLPREHGAWGQLLLALAVLLALGRPGLAAAGLALAAVLLFVAHEPLQVLLDGRGQRAQREEGTRARRLLGLLGALGTVAGALGAALAPPTARPLLLLPLGLGALAAVLAMARRERTTAGQLVLGGALASPGVPAAVASGAPVRHAIAAWALFTASFALASLAVRTVSARPVRAAAGVGNDLVPGNRARAGELACALLAFPLVPAVALALTDPARLPWVWALAFVPPALVAAGACLSRADARRLPRLGWTMMVANLAAAVLLVAGLR